MIFEWTSDLLSEWQSEWVDVVSGAPQGYVLRPVLFLMRIAIGLSGVISKFSEDSKLCKKIVKYIDIRDPQDDLKAVEWSEK